MTENEAEQAFKNSTVYLEKYLPNPRHIEIQVLSDSHGNCIHLGERDCSIQRRHQKIIEETPAPKLSDGDRTMIGDICTAACKKFGFVGAGTIEFLYQDNRFYFIEMNTRIQVEHGITEEVTGIDLVQEQILIAAGEKLSFCQSDVSLSGHAIECRINAEDPESFVPSPGTISNWHAPGGPGVRIDSHIYVNYSVPPYYDSLIGKIIVYGKDRQQAISKMRVALSETIVEGIRTNIPIHKKIIEDNRFIAGGVSINYLKEK
jgi:acetyl-CoA carboxylase biotin carboxylase subunit